MEVLARGRIALHRVTFALLAASPLTAAADSLSVNPGSVYAGVAAEGTVSLSSAAPSGGRSVALSSSSPAAASVPASVTVPAGATSARFPIQTAGVSANTIVMVTATTPAGRFTAPLLVQAIKVQNVSLSPGSLTGGAGSISGTVWINTTAPASVVLQLSSSTTAAVPPATVTVPAGRQSAGFTVATSGVLSFTIATITARFNGTSAGASILLLPSPPIPPAQVSLSPTSVVGGLTSRGTVTLRAPAVAGTVVALSSKSASATVPAFVSFSPGSTTATFTVSTSAVASKVSATISAAAGGVTRSASLAILPPSLAIVAVAPATVAGGASATGTVALDGPAPAGGAAVALSSDSASVRVPASVTVPAGSNSATFGVTTSAVTAATTAHVTGSYRGGSASATLTLTLTRPKTILVIGPHPDDETLLGAGRARRAVLDGDVVKMVVAVNGEEGSLSNGYTRQGYSVAAAQILGLTEQDVIFLGYSNQLYDMYRDASGSTVYPGAAGETSTYGNRGLGGRDYHSYLYGAPASFTRSNFLADVKDLIRNFNPDEIYTVSYFDAHPDHHGLALFVVEALVELERSGLNLTTQLFMTLVWNPGTDWSGTAWPYASDFGLGQPFTQPPGLDRTTLDWQQAVHLPVPPEMQSTDPASNLKLRAIDAYQSYIDDHLRSFARSDEFYWRYELGDDLALTATATASSTMWEPVQGAAKAIDGVAEGDYRSEWLSSGQLAGAWLQLDWASPVAVSRVNLHDLGSPSQNVVAGTLLFSDGSSVQVGPLDPHGHPVTVTFPTRTVTWIRFRVDQAEGTAAGLAEIEVFSN